MKEKIAKQKEAEERVRIRAKRTDKEQLARLDAGRYVAVRERGKLQKRINQRSK